MRFALSYLPIAFAALSLVSVPVAHAETTVATVTITSIEAADWYTVVHTDHAGSSESCAEDSDSFLYYPATDSRGHQWALLAIASTRSEPVTLIVEGCDWASGTGLAKIKRVQY